MNNCKILVVEDELIVAKNLENKLKKLGYEVVAMIPSGEEAIQKAIEEKPDLILMDIMLQGEMDGIETAEYIWTNYHIPVIYLTANADTSTLNRAKNTGSFGYLIKPFKEKELNANIELARLKHLEQEKLRQELAISQELRKKAEELSELRSRYMSITSHEFRNPLTSIIMSADLLEMYNDKWSEDKKKKHLQRIQKAVKNMNSLLEDVLTLGRMESGKLSFQPTRLNLVKLCEQILDELQIAELMPQPIVFAINGETQDAYIDEKLLRHILVNLLSNAIKYSPQGGRVDFTLNFDENWVVFQIRDRGIGIPPEDLQKLFETFHRAGNVGEIPGTGLGLSIVKSCVDLHQGDIYVESKVGEGTKFTVKLPISC
ncbi:response regulator [Planktothrix sp. FACHB-1355]|uniref:histidine kinase n=1 Tax=Aerosakkonema funiforme FACHB-1375 TaxID=2949571 RepID=A0A926VCN5_9CYAN|nr:MULTISPECIES: ATP-binding protein [Oscillatoriales]MBD2180089.1 response regulator [Aerosakkonema funiforme FACHB-1375]MBD3558013.1 response regulator [Planktothrix sp. FACHB-1355]